MGLSQMAMLCILAGLLSACKAAEILNPASGDKKIPGNIPSFLFRMEKVLPGRKAGGRFLQIILAPRYYWMDRYQAYHVQDQ